MRITNTMMINNSLANIAVNKNQLSTLDTQMSTKKKINRPSEDPIIAIRALRLSVRALTRSHSILRRIYLMPIHG